MQIKTHDDLIKAVGKRSPRGARWMMEDAKIIHQPYDITDINYVESIYLNGAFIWRNTPQGPLFWGNIDNKIYASGEYHYARMMGLSALQK